MGDLYEFAAATRDVPWAEAEACGWLNCAEAGGWLRPVAAGALLIETPDEAVERMLDERWRQHLKRAGVSTFSGVFAAEWQERERANVAALLAAAVGKEKT